MGTRALVTSIGGYRVLVTSIRGCLCPRSPEHHRCLGVRVYVAFDRGDSYYDHPDRQRRMQAWCARRRVVSECARLLGFRIALCCRRFLERVIRRNPNIKISLHLVALYWPHWRCQALLTPGCALQVVSEGVGKPGPAFNAATKKV